MRPVFDVLAHKDLLDSFCQHSSVRIAQSNQKNAVMGARDKSTDVSEMQVLSYEKSAGLLRRLPNLGIGVT